MIHPGVMPDWLGVILVIVSLALGLWFYQRGL